MLCWSLLPSCQRFNKVLKTFLRDFGSNWHDSIAWTAAAHPGLHWDLWPRSTVNSLSFLRQLSCWSSYQNMGTLVSHVTSLPDAQFELQVQQMFALMSNDRWKSSVPTSVPNKVANKCIFMKKRWLYILFNFFSFVFKMMTCAQRNRLQLWSDVYVHSGLLMISLFFWKIVQHNNIFNDLKKHQTLN